MDNRKVNKVYIISGPAGVGKSTTSKELVKTLRNGAYISGDYVSHMHVNGRKNPWESKKETNLIWDNILSLTKNFLRYGNDVVIDYVTFPQEAKWLSEHLIRLNAEVHYVVLWTDVETLVNRDNMRKPEHRMGNRCLILVDEFIASELDKKHIFDTSNINSDDIAYVVNEIISNRKYIMK